jgi:hypothetical protein
MSARAGDGPRGSDERRRSENADAPRLAAMIRRSATE